MRLLAAAALVTLAAGAVYGCGSSSNGGGPPQSDSGALDGNMAEDASPADAGSEAPAVVGYPAPHPPMPKVVTMGGPVMMAPKIVPITFQSDSLAPNIADFVAKTVAATAYWSGATAEYGVGPLSSTPPLSLAETPTAAIDDPGVQAWLTAKINGTDPDAGSSGDGGGPFPQPDANTIYTVFYPATVTLTLMGTLSCQGFDGYHSDFSLAGKGHVTYAIIMRCPPPAPGVSDIDNVAAIASHEFIEAATDPLAQDNPAWSSPDMNGIPWEYVGGGGEIGDMCAAFPGVYYKPPGLPYLVQRVWSNMQAAASHDPCQPGGTMPYFNSAPVVNDTLMINDPMAGMFTTQGVHIPVGQSATIELDLYSDAPTSGPWTVKAIDVSSAFFGGAPALSFSFDKTQGQNGDKIKMTINVLQRGIGGAEAFWIQSELNKVQTVWIGLVGN